MVRSRTAEHKAAREMARLQGGDPKDWSTYLRYQRLPQPADTSTGLSYFTETHRPR
jgi:hypothetical protein